MDVYNTHSGFIRGFAEQGNDLLGWNLDPHTVDNPVLEINVERGKGVSLLSEKT